MPQVHTSFMETHIWKWVQMVTSSRGMYGDIFEAQLIRLVFLLKRRCIKHVSLSARIQGEKITYSNCKRWAEVPGVPVTSTTEPPPVTVRTLLSFVELNLELSTQQEDLA